MKSHRERAHEILREAEESLRKLIDDAVGNRRFDQVSYLLTLIKKLTEIDGSTVSSPHAQAAVISTEADKRSDSLGNTTKPSNVSGGAHRRKEEYPVFAREEEYLVKIGLSRSSDETYEHRAPRSTVDAVAARALEASAQATGFFKAETLSDLRRHEDEQDLPSYQLYLCLGWFKSCGLVRRHGRKGYTIPQPATLERDIGTSWARLPDLADADPH